MYALRISDDLLQLLPESPLSNMPDQCPWKWLTARQRELLPVDYYHLVFSVPMRWSH
jgi:hypothetical protein